jgi:hypothetical protein
MVLLIYTDKNCEYQAIASIESLIDKVTNDVKILYFTIGFQSEYVCKNLIKVEIEQKSIYPSFHYYKAELSLKALYMFPNETHFIFSDTDILFSKRFDFNKLKHNYNYPMASYGPHECPFIYETIGDEVKIYSEKELMDYCGIKERTMRYVWSCFYAFNQNCKDFFIEYASFCQNLYFLKHKKIYYPFHDETSFNVLLWKYKANNNLGFSFVNTHNIDTIIKSETAIIKNAYGGNVDELGAQWEYIHDSDNVLFYHGIKEKESMFNALKFLKTYK